MNGERWELEFVENGIAVRSAEGILATLAYPITEAGTQKSSYVKRAAYLMVAAPELFDAVKTLVTAIESGNLAQLTSASGRGNAAIAKALNIDVTD